MPEEPRWHDLAASWWRALQPDDARRIPGNRAALARLRRCTTLAEIAGEREAIDLARRLRVTPDQLRRFEGVLLAAAVLAHVREDKRQSSVARSLGAAGPDQRAPMSPLRLTRLLSAQTFDERLIAFRRAVALLGGKANVPNLAHALLDWSEKTRIAWAFDYHGVPPPGTDTLPQVAGDAAA